MHQTGCRMGRLRAILATLGLMGVGFLATPVLADDGGDGAPNRAPRSAMEMCDLGVVLVVADDSLQAYVDRVADNAPAEDAVITVTRAHSRSPLAMEKVADGLFTAPYKPGHGVREDNLTVAVSTAAGKCEAKTKLVLESASPTPGGGGGFGGLLTRGVFSALLGGAVSFGLRLRGPPRSAVAIPLAKAT